ncbi:hybrid sensor histidine kinase/response regulator [Vibrio hepatarius]|uniref:hybrid sensor histidine kinase/response regulator n=1 Tax=Vibrio hepatarius TaxID=171383 RepID=UPI001C085F45|nr:hybrid sensor histidine kinase/response regulator [Vibrio hepatarius]MBU2895366.1 response regulator [Vibrio hepatarius]
MEIRSSLKRKSFLALTVYLVIVIAIIGSVSYLVVEPPIRDQLEKNLDLRTELIAAEIEEPLNSSVGILQSVVGIGNTADSQEHQAEMLFELFSVLDGVVVSGGLWPIPYSINPNKAYKSLFFNRARDGQVDQVFSWDNPESGGYDKESWYTSVVDQPAGTVIWSQVYIDPFTHVQMITASSSYFIDGAPGGVATIDISLESLIEFINKHAQEYELGVVLKDSYGDVITDYNFQVVKDIYMGSTEFGDFQWYIDVVNSNRFVDEEAFNVVTKVEAGIIPIMLACVMMGYVLINRFLISPIVLIAEKVNNSRAGGSIHIRYNSQDEIRQLIDTFNQKTKFLEQEKQKAQISTKAKSAFLATLSHEIRTPMNGVLGTAQILMKTDLSQEQLKHMKTLYDSGDHMMTLLNEILDFSKIEQGYLELEKHPFPLESILGSVNSVYFTLCSEKGLQFKVYSEVFKGRWYLSDKARLRQVLFNLLNNAVKFTSRGYVEVYFREIKQEGRNFLEIKVRDTGIGIAKDAHNKIFNPFEQAESSTTRRFGGTGLGLAIVKQICELMNGEITVTSEVGIGTSFRVTLEMEQCEPRLLDIKEHENLNYQGLKALIVEDNRTNAIIMNTFMTSKGFECEVAENGEICVEKIVNHNYDLILMDNHMPIMDGVEATIAIRALTSSKTKIVILGCTADVFKETRERMVGSGVDYVISKPIDETELDDALYRFSDRLYQYKPGLLARKDAKPQQMEPLLVNLFMALEDKDIPLAEEYFQRLRTELADLKDVLLVQTLNAVQEKLSHGEVPTQSDLDVLTVSLNTHQD